MRKMSLLLALALAVAVVFGALGEEIDLLSEDVELAVPEEELALEGEPEEDGYADFVGEADRAVSPETEESRVRITKPADGSTVQTGTLELWCRFVYPENPASWGTMIRLSKPVYVQILRDGALVDELTLNDFYDMATSSEGGLVGTISLPDPGVYTIRARCDLTPDSWDSITVTATGEPLPPPTAEPTPSPTPVPTPDPGETSEDFKILPVQTSYTLDMNGSRTARLEYTVTSRVDPSTFGGYLAAHFTFWEDDEEVVEVANASFKHEETYTEVYHDAMTGLWKLDQWIDFSAVKAGSSTLYLYAQAGETFYDRHEIAFTVIASTPTPEPTATPKATATAKPAATATTKPIATASAKPTESAKPEASVAPIVAPVPTATPVPAGGKFKTSTGTYKLAKDGTATFVKPAKSKATVTIPATVKVNGKSAKVTAIADKAFYKNTKLTKVTIGKNVKTIGKNAFYGCSKLKTVKGGAGVVTIKDGAFKDCKALTAITLNKKVKTVGKSAFYGCKKLKTVTIKTKKLTSKTVGSKAFKGIYSKATFKCPKAKLKAYKALLKKKGAPSKAKYR